MPPIPPGALLLSELNSAIDAIQQGNRQTAEQMLVQVYGALGELASRPLAARQRIIRWPRRRVSMDDLSPVESIFHSALQKQSAQKRAALLRGAAGRLRPHQQLSQD